MPIDLSAAEIARRVAAGETSAVAVATAFLDRTARLDPQVGAFLALDRPRVLAAAEAIDAKRRRGEALGKLAGVPVGIKDLLCARGEPATCGSRILERHVAAYDAGAIERLRAADAVPFGRLNMDEFAMGSSCENSAFQKTRNPWNLACVPGGSSGGSAAAVAARFCPLALGTDTGGSIRQPAAYCGIAGLKPTYGRVSRYGLIAFASSLDQIGPMARTVEDAALLLDVLAGPDPRDSTCAPDEAPDHFAALAKPLAGLRLGIVKEHFAAGLEPAAEAAARAAIDVFRARGATAVEVSLPHSRYGIPTYYLVATAEAASNLGRYDGTHYGLSVRNAGATLEDLVAESRGAGFGAEVKRRILLGTYALSSGYRDAYYLKAQQVRRLIKNDYDAAFKSCDLIVGPTAPSAAFRLGEKADDPMAMYLSDIYTVTANLAGVPALSLPCGFTAEGLPLGLQLQAPAFAEPLLLRAGRQYQQWTDWHARRPALAA